MFRKRNSQALAFVCVVAIFIALLTLGADARVIAGDLDNSVAVYYFTSLTDSGNVLDYSTNGLHGSLFNGARLRRISGRNCLSLLSNGASFAAWDDNTSLSVSKEFSIVAWVKIPWQLDPLYITVETYVSTGVSADFRGRVELVVDTDGDLAGLYTYANYQNLVWIETTDRIVNDDTWHHIGFVINRTRMRLYLNGNRIASKFVSRHRSFKGTGTYVSIDPGGLTRGSVDNVGFFKNDLSDAQIKLIYNKGLETIISIAPVDSSGKVATTWGALKKR